MPTAVKPPVAAACTSSRGVARIMVSGQRESCSVTRNSSAYLVRRNQIREIIGRAFRRRDPELCVGENAFDRGERGLDLGAADAFHQHDRIEHVLAGQFAQLALLGLYACHRWFGLADM